VPVDVGKRSAVGLVANHHGEVVADPVAFDLTPRANRLDSVEAIGTVDAVFKGGRLCSGSL
jgi:hypothetical protein